MDPRSLGCDCDNCPNRGCVPVFPQVVKSATLVVCGEAPGETEVEERRYFVGDSGLFLNDMLEHLGIPRNRLLILNAALCKPEASRPNWKKILDCCKLQLIHYLKTTRAKTVLTFGAKPMRVFIGKNHIFSWAGSVYKGVTPFEKYTIFPTLHPAFALRPQGWPYKPIVYQHTNRAWFLAQGKLKPWKWPRVCVEANKEALTVLHRILKEKLPIAFDTETAGIRPMVDKCLAIGIANKNVAVCMPWEAYDAGKFGPQKSLRAYPCGPEIDAAIRSILKKLPSSGQNANYDLLVFDRLGIEVGNFQKDTLRMHSITAQGRRHNLGWIACEETHCDHWKEEHAGKEKGSERFEKGDPIKLREYCARDTWMTGHLADVCLAERIEQEHCGPELLRSYMQNSAVALKMQKRGIQVNVRRFKFHQVKLHRRRKRALHDLRLVARRFWRKRGHKFNPNSQKHMRALFFDKFHCRPTRFSEQTGDASLNAEALNDLLSHSNPLCAAAARAVLRYRRWKKLLDYVSWKYLDKNRIAHPSWNPSGAKTLRWACNNPNLMNVPKPLTKKGKRGQEIIIYPGIRDIYVPHKKAKWIVRADYDQLELKIAALLAGDKILLNAFEKGIDPHTLNAMDIFDIKKPENVSKPERDMAKIAVYQMIYEGDPTSLWKKLIVDFPQVPLSACIRMHDNFFRTHPRFRQWHDEEYKKVLKLRYIRAPISGHDLFFFGRIDRQKIANYPVQHTASDIINPCVPLISKELNWTTEGILAQVHDELMLDGDDPFKLAYVLKKHMTARVNFKGRSMLFSVSLKVGKNWAECEEIKSKEDWQKRLAEICKLPRPSKRRFPTFPVREVSALYV